MPTKTISTDVSEIPQDLEAEIALMANALGGEKKQRTVRKAATKKTPAKKSAAKKVTPAKTVAKKVTAKSVVAKPVVKAKPASKAVTAPTAKKIDEDEFIIPVRKVTKPEPVVETKKEDTDEVSIPVNIKPRTPEPRGEEHFIKVEDEDKAEEIPVSVEDETEEVEVPTPIVMHQTNVSITSIEQPLYDDRRTPEDAVAQAEELAEISHQLTHKHAPTTREMEGLTSSLPYDREDTSQRIPKRLTHRSPVWLRAITVLMGVAVLALLLLQTNIIPL